MVPCVCPVTLTISHPPQCGVTQAPIPTSGHTCIYYKSRCETAAFGDCAPSGGISRLLTGKNICRNKRGKPHRSAVLSGKASYDRSAPIFCICHVDRSRDISNGRLFEHKRFLHFGRNDKIAIRRTWEDGS